ncbi:alpha/beta fold hydrolase [Sphingomonas sp. Root710]|uniref:alpha/beta fold hydrolase n=1 Tax=Sphingomonas sp. Root710 TaxID=1736594 RepID=UPI000A6E2765|nr:alpha/beta hydrolase [Sphingomonas sp. Root710]
MVQTKFQDAGKLRVRYKVAGDGVPLILLHGGTSDGGMFADILPYLAESFLTIAYDQRGCGGTTCEDSSDYSLEDLADDAAAFIEALGYEKAHILGHSAGGLVAQLLAVRSPRRVDKLILQSTAPITAFKKTLNDGAIQNYNKKRAEGGVHAAAELFTTPDYIAEHPEFVDKLIELQKSVAPEAMAQRLKALQTFDIDNVDLSRITMETLVIYAECDQLVERASVEQMANEVLPHARLEIFRGAGHAGVLQYPEGYAQLATSFLKGR